MLNRRNDGARYLHLAPSFLLLTKFKTGYIIYMKMIININNKEKEQ